MLMNQHQFIFSDQQRHRVARHVAFWLVWWLAYSILFHYPIHTFKAWSLDPTVTPNVFRNMEKVGLGWFIVKTAIFNSLLAVVLCQAMFTYAVIYGIFPMFIFKESKWIHAVIAVVILLFADYYVATYFKFFVLLGDYVVGLKKSLPPFNVAESKYSMMREQLSSLPIVTAAAIMIKLVKRWWQQQKQVEQLAREKTKAELQLLKAQIHPHFLFNTLNNIYFFTLAQSQQAPEMIKKLKSMLQYILNECNRPLVPLDQEIKMIHDYMALEKIRYGDQLEMAIETCAYTEKMIAPLLLIPFVENSFKHGASKMLNKAWIKLKIKVEDDQLQFSIVNSRPLNINSNGAKGNIGLSNVKRRLHLLYPSAHLLSIKEEPETFSVHLSLPLTEPSLLAKEKTSKPMAKYVMA